MEVQDVSSSAVDELPPTFEQSLEQMSQTFSPDFDTPYQNATLALRENPIYARAVSASIGILIDPWKYISHAMFFLSSYRKNYSASNPNRDLLEKAELFLREAFLAVKDYETLTSDELNRDVEIRSQIESIQETVNELARLYIKDHGDFSKVNHLLGENGIADTPAFTPDDWEAIGDGILYIPHLSPPQTALSGLNTEDHAARRDHNLRLLRTACQCYQNAGNSTKIAQALSSFPHKIKDHEIDYVLGL